jgi:hypothetical protein
MPDLRTDALSVIEEDRWLRLAAVPLENAIRAVTCVDVVGSGSALVLVDEAAEDGLSSNLVGLEVGDSGRGGRLVDVGG